MQTLKGYCEGSVYVSLIAGADTRKHAKDTIQQGSDVAHGILDHV